jgi:DNA-binding transcriptional MerR regulator
MKTKTTGRVAREANTSPTTVRNCVRRGLIVPLVLSDGRYAFDEEDVRRIRERPTKGPGRPPKGRGGAR